MQEELQSQLQRAIRSHMRSHLCGRESQSWDRAIESSADFLKFKRQLQLHSEREQLSKNLKAFESVCKNKFSIGSDSHFKKELCEMLERTCKQTSAHRLRRCSTLEVIDKISDVSVSLESQLSHFKEEAEFQKKILSQLKERHQGVVDQCQILQSQNHKLSVQLNSGQKEADKTVFLSQQDSWRQQQKFNFKQEDEVSQEGPCLRRIEVLGSDQNTSERLQSVLKEYGCIQEIGDSQKIHFPRTKTEALLLLNKVESLIQELEIKKLLQG